MDLASKQHISWQNRLFYLHETRVTCSKCSSEDNIEGYCTPLYLPGRPLYCPANPTHHIIGLLRKHSSHWEEFFATAIYHIDVAMCSYLVALLLFLLHALDIGIGRWSALQINFSRVNCAHLACRLRCSDWREKMAKLSQTHRRTFGTKPSQKHTRGNEWPFRCLGNTIPMHCNVLLLYI